MSGRFSWIVVVLCAGALAACGAPAPRASSGAAGAPYPSLEPVVVETFAYVDDGDPKHGLDVYAPAGAARDGRRAPVLVFFHGGVWQFGDRESVANVGEALAARGIVVVVASYRLTPQVVHPAHVQDAAAAVAWTLAHVADHGGDPARVVVGGHSAGGHLAALLALDPQWLAAHDVQPTALAGILPMSGVFDLGAGLDDSETGGVERYITPVFGADPAALQAASPIAMVAAGAALPVPCSMVLAGDDYGAMQSQSRRFLATLQARGVDASFAVVPGRDHFAMVARIGEAGDGTADLLAGILRAGR
jgi:acetyl esterase/lipase